MGANDVAGGSSEA